MQKYDCSVCGYTYNPEVGDPESCIPTDVSFNALAEDWLCPICRSEKEKFKENITS